MTTCLALLNSARQAVEAILYALSLIPGAVTLVLAEDEFGGRVPLGAKLDALTDLGSMCCGSRTRRGRTAKLIHTATPLLVVKDQATRASRCENYGTMLHQVLLSFPGLTITLSVKAGNSTVAISQ